MKELLKRFLKYFDDFLTGSKKFKYCPYESPFGGLYESERRL
jgi:hypothetical protein